ncbi:hypothetical protein PCE1_004153 [Barthelona sp. PCE]
MKFQILTFVLLTLFLGTQSILVPKSITTGLCNATHGSNAFKNVEFASYISGTDLIFQRFNTTTCTYDTVHTETGFGASGQHCMLELKDQTTGDYHIIWATNKENRVYTTASGSSYFELVGVSGFSLCETNRYKSRASLGAFVIWVDDGDWKYQLNTHFGAFIPFHLTPNTTDPSVTAVSAGLPPHDYEVTVKWSNGSQTILPDSTSVLPANDFSWTQCFDFDTNTSMCAFLGAQLADSTIVDEWNITLSFFDRSSGDVEITRVAHMLIDENDNQMNGANYASYFSIVPGLNNEPVILFPSSESDSNFIMCHIPSDRDLFNTSDSDLCGRFTFANDFYKYYNMRYDLDRHVFMFTDVSGGITNYALDIDFTSIDNYNLTCPNGEVRNTTTYECFDCSSIPTNGTGGVVDGFCGCDDGYHFFEQACHICPANTYINATHGNSTEACVPCQSGYSLAGSDNCTVCNSDKVWNSATGLCDDKPDEENDPPVPLWVIIVVIVVIIVSVILFCLLCCGSKRKTRSSPSTAVLPTHRDHPSASLQVTSLHDS